MKKIILLLSFLLYSCDVYVGTATIIDKSFSEAGTYSGTGISTKGSLNFQTMYKDAEYYIVCKDSGNKIIKIKVSMQYFYNINIGERITYEDHWYGINVKSQQVEI